MPTSPIDLTTIAAVKPLLGIDIAATKDDALIQRYITSISRGIVNRTGRSAIDPTSKSSELSAVVSVSERFDGNGGHKLVVNHYPVQSISKLQVGTITIPQSTNYACASGWAISSDQRYIVLIGNQYCFHKGRMNVLLECSAGYDGTPEDLEQAVIDIAVLNYKRKDRPDEASRMIPEGGTLSFRSFVIPPLADETIRYYKRYTY